jgi:hypothetical protein
MGKRTITVRTQAELDGVIAERDAATAEVTVREYTPHTGRIGYSVTSADEARVFLVTPDCGPGKFSPVRGWIVWKSDSLSTIARFAATDAGRDRAIARATELVN